MSKPIVAITHPADKVGKFYTDADLARLEAVAEVRILGGNEPELCYPQLADVDVLSGSWGMLPLTPELLTAAPKLRAVCYAAGSIKNFATDAAYDRGIVITSAWLANAVPVAEVSVALITLANKNWFACQDRIRAGGHEAFYDLKESPHPGNFGATVGLIGMGAIGRMVAERLQGFDLKMLAYDPHQPAERLEALGCEAVSDLVELAQRCDTVSLHAPNIPETEGMLDAAFFQAMQDGASFINTARGKLVVEDALVAELETGRIKAMLDVTFPEPPEADHPFYRLPNCWLTPHRAGSSSNEVQRMGQYAVDNCVRILAGEEPLHAVSREMLATMA